MDWEYAGAHYQGGKHVCPLSARFANQNMQTPSHTFFVCQIHQNQAVQNANTYAPQTTLGNYWCSCLNIHLVIFIII